jgi:Holliday junction resolvase RusA-like endonuclease
MADIKLIIPGEPKYQQRHKSALLLRKGCRGVDVKLADGTVEKLYRKKDFFIHNYDPSAKDKEEIRRMVRSLVPPRPLDEPLEVIIFLYFSRPKSHYGTGRNAGKLKDSAPYWKESAPDRDNADKILLDALKGMFWRDDSIVVAGPVIKQYSEIPRTEIYINKIKEMKGCHYEDKDELKGGVPMNE